MKPLALCIISCLSVAVQVLGEDEATTVQRRWFEDLREYQEWVRNPATPDGDRMSTVPTLETEFGGPVRFPDFIVIGATKGGNTFLKQMLYRTCEMSAKQAKETHFWDNNLTPRFVDEDAMYLEKLMFKYGEVLTQQCRDDLLCVDLTPSYMLLFASSPQYHRSLEYVASTLPYLKVLVLLRDPVDRFQSEVAMNMVKSKGKTAYRGPPPGMMRNYVERCKTLKPFGKLRIGDNRSCMLLQRGRYAALLEEWIKAFGRERICVVKSSNLYNDTYNTLKTALRCLGVADISALCPDFEDEYRNAIERALKRKSKMDVSELFTEDDLQYLRAFYDNDNANLSLMLDGLPGSYAYDEEYVGS